MKALGNLANNYFSDHSIVEFFKSSCYQKSASISQNAFKYLSEILPKIDPSYSLEICLSLENCKRQGTKLGAKSHIKYLSQTWPQFDEAFAKLSEREKVFVEQCLAQKNQRASLRECIQASKIKDLKSFESLE